MFDPHAWPHYVAEYGYLAIFLLSLVEGPIVTIYAALLAAQGVFNILLLYPIVVFGDLTGDLLLYALGRAGVAHPGWQRHFGNFNHRRRVAMLRRRLRSHAGHVLLFGKLTQVFGFAILLAAGAAHVRIGKFLFYNLLGTLPKAAALIAAGYFFGRFYVALSQPLQMIGFFAFGTVIVSLLYLINRFYMSSSNISGARPCA